MNNESTLPPEYGFLNPSLFKAQEYAFAIYQEIEAIERNPLNEKRVAILQDELKSVINGVKNDVENQTWEDGPIKSQEIASTVDSYLGFDTYQAAKNDNACSARSYQEIDYWGEKFAENRAVWDAYYKAIDEPYLDLDEYDDLTKE